MYVKDFLYLDTPEPHKERTKQILKAHPEVRALMGRNPYSALLVIGVVFLQLFTAYQIQFYSWWFALIIAYFIGAFANHALYVLIHDASHNLIFKNKGLNNLAGVISDIPNLLPSAISFKKYHMKHHSFQGNYYLDADLASKWEAKFIGHSFFGKAMWELFFPFFQALRTPRMKEINFVNIWVVINMVVVFGADILIAYFWGWNSILYLAGSFVFSIGFHPLGARWIQEHFLVAPPQETYSYYGPLNFLALNVGYHNEHHDFSSIPWNNLPKVRDIAPEFYNNLYYHTSWFKLWLKFIFDPKLSLFSRVVRENRAGLTVTND